MSAVLVLAGLALMALPGVAASRGARLSPSEWGRLNFAALRLGLTAVHAGLFLMAAPTVLRAAGVHTAADACHRLFGPAVPGGAITGWTAAGAGVLLLATTRLVRRRSLREQRTARVEAWLGEHEQGDGTEIVFLPTDSLVAYATPGKPPQVVVSHGLVGSLSPAELDAVVHHELAHVRHRHDRYLVLAATVDATLGWLPGMRPSTGALRLGVERWADEASAERPGARDSVHNALLKTTETMLGAVPAFTAAATLLARLDALEADPPEPGLGDRAIVAAPMAGLAVVIASCLVLWGTYPHHGVAGLVGLCRL
jgi:Zn-dependent protease with chaperone function